MRATLDERRSGWAALMVILPLVSRGVLFLCWLGNGRDLLRASNTAADRPTPAAPTGLDRPGGGGPGHRDRADTPYAEVASTVERIERAPEAPAPALQMRGRA